MGGPLLVTFVLLTPQLRHRGKQPETEKTEEAEEKEEVVLGRERMVVDDWQEEVLKGLFSARKRALAPV